MRSSLLARKGTAVPVGAADLSDLVAETPTPEPGGVGLTVAPPADPMLFADLAVQDSESGENGSAPAASLSPVHLRRAVVKGKPALDQPVEHAAALRLEPLAANAKPRSKAVSTPTPVPERRLGAGALSQPKVADRRSGPLAALIALGIVLGLGIILAVTRISGPDKPETAVVVPEPAAKVSGVSGSPADGDAAGATVVDAVGKSDGKDATVVTDTATDSAEPETPSPVDRQAKLPPPSAPDSGAGQASSVSEKDPSQNEIETGRADPSVDVVRIDADGMAVIAGRAGPGSQLIVLDNGAPVGSVTADAFGEWVLVPEAPLPTGDHEFSLVVKGVRGSVTVPRTQKTIADEPADLRAPDAQPAPIPERKPDAGKSQTWLDKAKKRGALKAQNLLIPDRKPLYPEPRTTRNGQKVFGEEQGGDFVVQLAAVPTENGARQEWIKLRQKFPEILGSMKLNLDEAKVNGHVSVVRVRTGAFITARSAWNLCKRFEAQDQDCLVVQTILD
jgi:hypothetical protein